MTRTRERRRLRRQKQHQHALDRLRERYFADATIDDVIAIRDAARVAAKGRCSLHEWSDCVGVTVPYRGLNVQVIYTKIDNAVRTVLPGGVEVVDIPAASTPARSMGEGL